MQNCGITFKALFHSSQNQVGFCDERKRAFIAARKLNYVYFKNSLIIYEEKTKEITAVSVVLYKKIMFIYINFSFDFLGLDNLYF